MNLKSYGLTPHSLIPQNFISIALYGLMLIFLYINAQNHLESYTTSDWLVNYQGGFIRRGLIGQIVYLTSWNRASALWMIFAIQSIAVLATSWLILKIYFYNPKNYSWLLILLSPAFFFTFTFYDVSASLRKELLIFLAMSLLIYSLIGNQIKIGLLRTALLVYIVTVYSHEMASLCLPFFIYPLFISLKNITAEKKRLYRYIALFTAIAISGLIGSIVFNGDERSIANICQSLTERGFSDYACTGGAIQFMNNSLSWAISYLADTIKHPPFILLFLCSFMLSLVPILCTNWIADNRVRLLLIVGFIFLLPLFITGIDWGRWIHIFVVLSSLCLLFDAAHQKITIWPFSKGLLIAYLACWTLPPWFEKPQGILQGYSNSFPQMGVLDKLYPLVFPPTKNAKIKALENDPEYKKQLAYILKSYPNVIFYPIKNNSEAQSFLARLAFSKDINVNLSVANLISPLPAFNTKNKSVINEQNKGIENIFASKTLDPNSLYIFAAGDLAISTIFPAINPEKDAMIDAGIYTIVAPNWRSCANCPLLKGNYARPYDLGFLKPATNLPILFSHSNNGENPLTVKGWQPFAEDWGVWSDGKFAYLALPIPTAISKRIEINARAFIVGSESTLPIAMKFNDGTAIHLELSNFENNHLVLDLPKSLFEKPFITIEFAIESPKKPKDYGLGDDDRLIGIGLKSVQFLR